MRNLLRKEFKLSASPLSYLFIAFGLMFFLPGYPILCGEFFVTLGIFQSFQNARETNDILFSALLPIAKRDVVKGKYLFVVFIEGCSLLLMAAAVTCRMTWFASAALYRSNALLNANPFALGMAFLLFGLFNLIFLGSFFKTAYQFARPFIGHLICTFVTIGMAEALPHFPGMEALNAFGFDHLFLQLILLLSGIILFLLLTLLSFKRSCKRFESINL